MDIRCDSNAPQLPEKGEEGYTRINFYIEQIFDCLDHLTQVRYFVADGFYAKKKMFQALFSMDKYLITKLRPDANLKFRLEGEHPKRKGPKSPYEGKAVYDDLSKWHFVDTDAKYAYLSVYLRLLPKIRRGYDYLDCLSERHFEAI